MYVLQVTTGKESSVVLGVYDSYQLMLAATQKFYDENLMKSNHYFYDVKKMNADAEWTNEQSAVRITK